MIDQFIQPRLEGVVPSKCIKSHLKNVPDDPQCELVNMALGPSSTPSSSCQSGFSERNSYLSRFPSRSAACSGCLSPLRTLIILRTLRRSALSRTQTKQSSLLSWRWAPPPSPPDPVQLVVGREKQCSFHSSGCAEFLQGHSKDLICDGLQVSFRFLGSLWKISACDWSCHSWEKPNYHCGEMPGRRV